jgi:glutathione S-transferase
LAIAQLNVAVTESGQLHRTPLPASSVDDRNLILVDRAKNAQKSREYLKINPNGRIPALVDGDLVLFEAAAIVLHLVDQHPKAGLAPKPGTPERARFYQWMTFLTNVGSLKRLG